MAAILDVGSERNEKSFMTNNTFHKISRDPFSEIVSLFYPIRNRGSHIGCQNEIRLGIF